MQNGHAPRTPMHPERTDPSIAIVDDKPDSKCQHTIVEWKGRYGQCARCFQVVDDSHKPVTQQEVAR